MKNALLETSAIVDFTAPTVAALAASLRAGATSELEVAERAFVWVRDEIQHSVDFRRGPVTCVASDVLRHGVGYCYAKSHLLVALLRANGIASGFVYQRLTVSGPTAPFCLHGLVALALPDGTFFRVDPRGNRAARPDGTGVIDARFEPPRERLAFTNDHPGERLFPGVYAEPLPEVVEALRRHDDWAALLADLPDAETPSRAPDLELPLQVPGSSDR